MVKGGIWERRIYKGIRRNNQFTLLLGFRLQAMQTEKYTLKADPNKTVFRFVSEGRVGKIQKIIEFQYVAQSGFYNLAFGDKLTDSDEMDDLSITNNGDTEKVLRTVVDALYVFLDTHPNAAVFAAGSTIGRTRLYRMGITRYYEEVNRDFELLGLEDALFEDFVPGKDYKGFLVKRKLA